MRRLRAGLPDRRAASRSRVIELGQPEHSRDHHLRLLRRRLHLQGRDAGRHGRAHGAVEGRQGEPRPFLREGPLRLGLRHPPGPHPEADDAREDHRSVARGVAGTRRSATSPREFKRIQATVRQATRSASSPRRAAPNEETYLVQKLVRAGVRQQQRRHLRARLPFADRLRAEARRSAPRPARRISTRSMQADVIMVIGANPTDGHPVFASRMKKRLRQGAKLIVVDPRRIDLVRMPHVEARYHLPLRPGTNVAVLTALAHVIVTEGLVDEDFVRERCDCGRVRRTGRRSSPKPRNSPEEMAKRQRRAGRRRSATRRGCTPSARQRRDLLRARRDRAQPGHHRGDGAGEPRDGDRQYRPRGRRREPAARAEQRAGQLRHGLVPARVARLPARLRSRGARDLRDASGA